MRIAIGQIMHETNTMFGPPTPLSEFERQGWHAGKALIERYGGSRNYLNGMLDAGQELGVEIVPTFAANAHPSGTIATAAFAALRATLLAELRAAMPVDAVVLALHGAGSAEGVDDIEGAILADVRALVGDATPLVATLDLHCHMTDQMLASADALLHVHHYPHTDGYERGVEALHLAVQMVRGAVRPVMELVRLPMMLAPVTTDLGPALTITERCWAWEREEGVIDCAFVHGYPHTDVPMICTSVLVTTDNERALARRVALDVANAIWEMREEFLSNLPAPADAIQQALNAPERPVVVAEVSDNPGGGAPGDSTHLLRALLAADAPDTAFGFVYDPETAQQAHAAGPGATIQARLGGKTDPTLLGLPIEVNAYVKCVSDGRFITQSRMGRGALRDMGKMARLVVGNVDVIVGSESAQTIDAELFLLHGIDVTRYKVVALKSQNHFRAGFEGLAKHIIRSDAPGWTTSNLHDLPFQRIKRPIWPLDPDVEWEGAAN